MLYLIALYALYALENIYNVYYTVYQNYNEAIPIIQITGILKITEIIFFFHKKNADNRGPSFPVVISVISGMLFISMISVKITLKFHY